MASELSAKGAFAPRNKIKDSRGLDAPVLPVSLENRN